MKIAFASLAAALMAGGCLIAATEAAAQPGPSVTFYDQAGYRGGSITFSRGDDNLDNTGFNDRPQSAQFRGSWRVCEAANYRGACQILSGNIPDLNAYGMGGRISSIQPVGDDPSFGRGPATPPVNTLPPPAYADRDRDRYPGAGPGGQYPGGQFPGGQVGQGGYEDQDDGVEGRTVVFFARPVFRGQDIAANRPRVADEFCRRNGLGAAVYFDQSERGRRTVDIDGRNVGTSPVLRDVLCRK